MALGTSTELCYHRHHPSPELFSSCRTENVGLPLETPPPPPPASYAFVFSNVVMAGGKSGKTKNLPISVQRLATSSELHFMCISNKDASELVL